MPTNAKYLLEAKLVERKQAYDPSMRDSDFFELFVAEEILKGRDLGPDEIEAGIIDGGNDGGIDAIYCFVNDLLLKPGYDPNSVRGEPRIEVIVIQAKSSDGFTEQAILRLDTTFAEIFDSDIPIDKFASAYNPELIEFVESFRSVHESLAGKFPVLTISVYYATKSDDSFVHPNVERLKERLENRLSKLFYKPQFRLVFMGAQELITLTRNQVSGQLPLSVQSFIIEGESYICLVRLQDYFKFITVEAEDGKLVRRPMIFDGNVREYEGEVQVNKSIRQTLENRESGINFWWLNNGITIVASRATFSARVIRLDNPRVVNGLQTSTEIINVFRNSSQFDDRQILVRIIVIDDEQTQNRIIFATNNQTKVPEYSLRATDKIQIDIEEYFRHMGFHYDRRKNSYRNEEGQVKVSRRKIVSIIELGQAVMAVVLQEPNNARGRPTDLIRDANEYARVFSDKYDMRIYLECIRLMNTVDDFFKSDRCPTDTKSLQRDIRFQVASTSPQR